MTRDAGRATSAEVTGHAPTWPISSPNCNDDDHDDHHTHLPMPPRRAFVSWDPKTAKRQAPTDAAFLACYATGDVAHLTRETVDAMAYPTTKINIQVLQFLLYSALNAAWESSTSKELDATVISPHWVERWNQSSCNELPGLLQLANPLDYRWIIWPIEVEDGRWVLLVAINVSSLVRARPGPEASSGTSLVLAEPTNSPGEQLPWVHGHN